MEEIQPSTSKQTKREDRNDGSGRNDVSESEHKRNANSRDSRSSWSHSYSTKSLIDMAQMVIDSPKPELNKKGEDRANGNEKRRRRRRRVGRVNKRKRSVNKIHGQRVIKRKPPNRGEKRKRNASISTIFTRLSSSNRSCVCWRCGHRCCEKRSEYSFHRRGYRRYEKYNRRKVDRKDLKIKRAIKGSVKHISGSAAVQVGSRADMLSPLFIKTNYTPEEHQHKDATCCEVSPEMIYEAVRNLSMWKQEVKTDAILEYIKIHYPVDPDSNVVLNDLLEKLRIAALVASRTPVGVGVPEPSWKTNLMTAHDRILAQIDTNFAGERSVTDYK